MRAAIDKLNDRVINIAKNKVVHVLKTCDVDHKEVFFKGPL